MATIVALHFDHQGKRLVCAPPWRLTYFLRLKPSAMPGTGNCIFYCFGACDAANDTFTEILISVVKVQRLFVFEVTVNLSDFIQSDRTRNTACQ